MCALLTVARLKAVYDTLKALYEGKTSVDLKPTLASSELLAEVSHHAQYAERIEHFLS